MEPRISIVTLGVADLERAHRFYHEGLGWPTTWSPDKGIVFFQTKGTCFALYPYDKAVEEIGATFAGPRSKFAGITLAHNVRTREEVDAALALAERAGAAIVKPAKEAFWGGYSGYFADPDGYLWEVAYGAFEIRDDGSLVVT